MYGMPAFETTQLRVNGKDGMSGMGILVGMEGIGEREEYKTKYGGGWREM